jgi:hypothetical protein
MNQPQVTGLYVYPVKSMKGIAVDEAIITARGLLHDRVWMVVRPDGRFVTQRGLPMLSQVHTRLEETAVVLSFEGHGSITLPFESAGGSVIETKVWGDDCRAQDEGPLVSQWLTDAVESPETLRIVRMADGFTRPQSQPDRFGPGTTTHFADSAPFLVANQDSLDELNRVLETEGHEAVPMDRFRPNIVVRGMEAFSEHRARQLAGEDWQFGLADACERCLVTTIDQATGQRDPAREPYLTLRRINPADGPNAAPAFGQNAVLSSGEGRRIRVGAACSVTW